MDQFYTKPDIARQCLDSLKQCVKIDPENETEYLWVEPSAGTGSFFSLLPDSTRIGIDLDPKYDGIIQQDFLTTTPDMFQSHKKPIIVVGNPPFGRVSSLAVKFFQHASLFADWIAFIIPRTFKRVSVQNKLHRRFHLIQSTDLSLTPCCFTPAMSAKCCFQIWQKRQDIPPRPLVELPTTHPDFRFIKHGPKDERNQPTPPPTNTVDFALKAYGAHCGTIVLDNLHTLRPKSWHWIKAEINRDVLVARFKELDYSISRDTVRQDSIGQRELIALYMASFPTT